jgi:hypothetical protein
MVSSRKPYALEQFMKLFADLHSQIENRFLARQSGAPETRAWCLINEWANYIMVKLTFKLFPVPRDIYGTQRNRPD